MWRGNHVARLRGTEEPTCVGSSADRRLCGNAEPRSVYSAMYGCVDPKVGRFGAAGQAIYALQYDAQDLASQRAQFQAAVALYEAATVILTQVVTGSDLKNWALRVAQRAGLKKAKVALARNLAVVLHRMRHAPPPAP